MTTLKWRLSKLPTVEELTSLVDKKIITTTEAKAVLFSQNSEEESNKLGLQEEIEFLRALVQKMASSRSEIVKSIEYIHVPYKNAPWYPGYQAWCSSNLGSSNLNTQTQLATGSTNAIYSYANTQANFVEIKTF